MKKQNVRTLSFIVGSFTYLLIGAAIFESLESQQEETLRNELDRFEHYFKSQYNISDAEFADLECMVIKYETYRNSSQWSFPGAFYFSLTVITTIGYGYSTPATAYGKLFCVLYAIIGIPLCLVMFQSVGVRLNHFDSYWIKGLKKCLRARVVDVNQTERVLVSLTLSVLVIAGGAAMFSQYEGWTFFDSIYYCVITLTTIGFGDFVVQ